MGNMKLNGMFKEDEQVEWLAPGNQYKFIIKRADNQLWANEVGGKYIVTIDIFNNIGVPITQLKFTELDTIRIITSIFEFMEIDQTYSSYNIYVNPSNPRFDFNCIYLVHDEITRYLTQDQIEKLDETGSLENSIYYDYTNCEVREILFQINQSNQFINRTVNKVSMYLSDSELFDLIYKLYFEVLIDIDIPNQYLSEAEFIYEKINNITNCGLFY